MSENISTTIVEETPKQGFGTGSIVLLAAIIIAGLIVGLALARQNQGRPLAGDAAPDFEFTSFDGTSYRLSDFRGQVVVLNFWASWCVPCADEAPELQATFETYRERGVSFLGIAYADNGPKSLQFLDTYGITYLNAPDLGTVVSDFYEIEGVPETFVIDQEGIVREFIYAGVSQAQLAPILDGLLAGGQ